MIVQLYLADFIPVKSGSETIPELSLNMRDSDLSTAQRYGNY